MILKSNCNESGAKAMGDVCLIHSAYFCIDLQDGWYLYGAGVAGPVVVGGKVRECGTCTWSMLSSLPVRSCDMND